MLWFIANIMCGYALRENDEGNIRKIPVYYSASKFIVFNANKIKLRSHTLSAVSC